MVESYYEDKYADLEKKRKEAEADLQRNQALQFQNDYSLQHHLGIDEPKNEDGLKNMGGSRDLGYAGANMANSGQ